MAAKFHRSLITMVLPPPEKRSQGTTVHLLSRPEPTAPPPAKIPPRTKELQIPDEKVRLVRALLKIGLHRALVARMTGCSAASVSEYGQMMRRRSAGTPSDKEILDAGSFAAEYAIAQRGEQ
jgi:hypothetical protein